MSDKKPSGRLPSLAGVDEAITVRVANQLGYQGERSEGVSKWLEDIGPSGCGAFGKALTAAVKIFDRKLARLRKAQKQDVTDFQYRDLLLGLNPAPIPFDTPDVSESLGTLTVEVETPKPNEASVQQTPGEAPARRGKGLGKGI